jgi:hypothetical protein
MCLGEWSASSPCPFFPAKGIFCAQWTQDWMGYDCPHMTLGIRLNWIEMKDISSLLRVKVIVRLERFVQSVFSLQPQCLFPLSFMCCSQVEKTGRVRFVARGLPKRSCSLLQDSEIVWLWNFIYYACGFCVKLLLSKQNPETMKRAYHFISHQRRLRRAWGRERNECSKFYYVIGAESQLVTKLTLKSRGLTELTACRDLYP